MAEYLRLKSLAVKSADDFHEVILKDWCHAIVIPEAERKAFDSIIPDELIGRVYYLPYDCRDIWEWSEKVYEFVKTV